MSTSETGSIKSLNGDGRYGVIYADPPWSFKNYSEKGTGRNPVAHYDCLTVEQLKRLPVGDLAAKDSVLFLWAVDPLLPQAMEVMSAWGFSYKTVGFYWAKLNRRSDPDRLTFRDFFTGLGYWTRANVEQCLLGTRGKPPRLAKDVRKLIISRRREHSRKPEEAYARIERLAHGPYLEIFARESRPNWESWGDQAAIFDTGVVSTRNRPSNMSRQESLQMPQP